MLPSWFLITTTICIAFISTGITAWLFAKSEHESAQAQNMLRLAGVLDIPGDDDDE